MKEFLKKLNLDDEIYNKILNKYDDDINKLNQDLETANKTLDLKNKELVEVNKNIKELEKLEPEKIKEELENTKVKMKELEQNHKTELYNLKIDNAINTELLKNGAKNNKTVIPLLDRNFIKLDDKGNITGISEQIQSLIKNQDTSFLFNQKEQVSIKGLAIQANQGATPGNSSGTPQNNINTNKQFEYGKVPSYETYLKNFEQ